MSTQLADTTIVLLRVKEAAVQLGRPTLTVYRWIEAGKIVGVRLGGFLYVPRSEVERIKAEQDKAGGAG